MRLCHLFLHLISINFAVSVCRPVLVVAGMLDFSRGIQVCIAIKRENPNAKCHTIQPGGVSVHLKSLPKQVEIFQKALMPYFNKYPEGVDVYGHSLGGVILDGVIKRTANHTIKTFINAGGPLMGVYGTSYMDVLDIFGLNNYKNRLLSKWKRNFYSPQSQRSSPIANLWRDPTNKEDFLSKNVYLPKNLNLVKHEQYEDYKRNFLRVSKIVYIVGSKERLVVPKVSILGGFYNKNLEEVELEKQEIYINNTFGMQTMHKRGNLKRIIATDVGHLDFLLPKNIQRFILPQLTCEQ